MATGKLLNRSLASQVSLVSLAGDGKHSKAAILYEKELYFMHVCYEFTDENLTFNSFSCISSSFSAVFGLILAGSQPKSPGLPPLDSIEAARTSTAAIAKPILQAR